MRTKYLSKSEREIGKKNFLRFSAFNGFTMPLLLDTTIILMALHFGATNIQIGYLSSAIHISGFFLVLLPILFGGMNIVKVFYISWLIRGMICLLYGLTFFLEGQTAVILILITYTLFCLVRHAGVAVFFPVLNMITKPSETGNMVAGHLFTFARAVLLARILSYIVLSIHFFSGLLGLLFLQLLGIATNTMSAFIIKKIPAREVIEKQAGSGFIKIFFKSVKNKKNTKYAYSLLVFFIYGDPDKLHSSLSTKKCGA